MSNWNTMTAQQRKEALLEDAAERQDVRQRNRAALRFYCRIVETYGPDVWVKLGEAAGGLNYHVQPRKLDNWSASLEHGFVPNFQLDSPLYSEMEMFAI